MKKQGRRKFITGFLGILGSSFLTAWFFRRELIRKLLYTSRDNPFVKVSVSPVENGMCLLTAKQVEGPFYFPAPERSVIVEDRVGKSLLLRMQIMAYPGCLPIKNAVVEVWHADAEGNYSGYPEQIGHDEWKTFMLVVQHGHKKDDGELTVAPVTDSRYLRGLQRTDENGWVAFNTIVPGWYIGRVPHIHFKVFLDDKEHISSQLYFDKDFCDALYMTEEPYKKAGKCPMGFENDGVLASAKGDQEGLLLSIQRDKNSGCISSCRIGIKTV